MAKRMFVTFVVEAVAETNKSRVETLDWLGMQECRSPDCRSPTLMSVPVCVYVPSSLCACVSVPLCVCMCLPLCVLFVCACGIFVCVSLCVCVSLLSASVGFSNFALIFVYFC